MSGTLTPPSSINDVRTQAHLQIGARLAGIDLTQILVYVIKNVPAAVLPFLAWQFDMTSPWWALLASTSDQRTLIQQAIGLHAKMGTPAAITTIMASLGFSGAEILEGQDSWGGSTWPDNEGWAEFRVVMPRGGAAIPASVQAQAIGAIKFFKPERCWLDALQFTDTFSDPAIVLADSFSAPGVDSPIPITDTFTAPIQAITDVKKTTPYHNAHFYHTGLTHGGTQPAIVDSGFTINGTPTA
jgi:phage tail P2-like protein